MLIWSTDPDPRGKISTKINKNKLFTPITYIWTVEKMIKISLFLNGSCFSINLFRKSFKNSSYVKKICKSWIIYKNNLDPFFRIRIWTKMKWILSTTFNISQSDAKKNSPHNIPVQTQRPFVRYINDW